jgi:IS1 family transposase
VDIFKKKQKKVKREGDGGDTAGDAWIYGSIKRKTYFFVAFAVGKWTQETCRRMVEQIPGRFAPLSEAEEKATFYSDGNDDYTYVLPRFFPVEKLEYGQLVKIRENGRVVGKEKRVIYGNPEPLDIETTDIENFGGILRERLGRLVRETKCHSKLKARLEDALALFQFHWDFMDPLQGKNTPAMLEGLTEDVFSWHQFFYFPLTIPN